MVDFINEVEEELRKDKYNALLRKYGAYIIAIIVAIVAVSGFMEYRKSSAKKIANAASRDYIAADKLESAGTLNAAANKFIELAQVSPPGYAGMSYSRAAGIMVQLGDFNGAVKMFDQAANSYIDPLHKDLAGIKASLILLELGRLDDVKTRTLALEASGSAYKDMAGELSAYAMLRSDEVDLARKKFTFLVNAPGVHPGVQARAGQALALLNSRPEAAAPEAPTLEDIPAPTPVSPADGPGDNSNETPEEN